jgi:hypothetical protein
VTDLVRQLAASPVLGLLDLAVQARDDFCNLVVQLVRLLFGCLGGKKVNQLVLPDCRACSFRTRRDDQRPGSAAATRNAGGKGCYD